MNGTVLLLAAVSIAFWLVSLWLHPYRPCPRCSAHAVKRGGSGRNRGSGKRSFGSCRKCDGTGRVRRIGARAVHRSIEAARKGIRERRQR